MQLSELSAACHSEADAEGESEEESVSCLRPHLGELLDRESILILKIKNSKDRSQRLQFVEELQEIAGVIRKRSQGLLTGASTVRELAEVNQELWALEDEIRRAIAGGVDPVRVTALTIAVVTRNDRRAALIHELGQLEQPGLSREKLH